MEIKAELILPYTENERLNFIASQNHRLGYDIRQVEGTWQEEIQVPCMKTVTEITQEPIFDDEGNPVLDNDGNPTYKDVIVTREIQETETIVEIVKQSKYDEDGNPVLDESGEQVLEDVEVEKEIPKYRTEIVTHTGYNLQAWGYTEAEKQEQERERLNLLSMTKREMFLGLYQAKQITPDMLKYKITDPQALIEFEYANDYYRGNQLIDVIGGRLGFTSEQLDRFFETKDYHELLQVEDEVVDENTTDTTTDIPNEVGE